MKINIGTLIAFGAIVYLITRPKSNAEVPIIDIPVVDDPGAENPPVLENATDVFTTDAAGNQVYHHTEVINETGGTDIYVLDPATGTYIFVKPKQERPKGSTNVSGIRGGNFKKRSAKVATGLI